MLEFSDYIQSENAVGMTDYIAGHFNVNGIQKSHKNAVGMTDISWFTCRAGEMAREEEKIEHDPSVTH